MKFRRGVDYILIIARTLRASVSYEDKTVRERKRERENDVCGVSFKSQVKRGESRGRSEHGGERYEEVKEKQQRIEEREEEVLALVLMSRELTYDRQQKSPERRDIRG